MISLHSWYTNHYICSDIANFTAWSSGTYQLTIMCGVSICTGLLNLKTFVLSVRDPNQVFTLLEKIYRSFDKIAERRSIFKVETVGDCYVAGK
jgi:Adenylate and Guanylate cyclase catalytic domain